MADFLQDKVAIITGAGRGGGRGASRDGVVVAIPLLLDTLVDGTTAYLLRATAPSIRAAPAPERAPAPTPARAAVAELRRASAAVLAWASGRRPSAPSRSTRARG